MIPRIPTDSAEARELREAEEAQGPDVQPTLSSSVFAGQPRRTPHDARCRGGWLGEDEHDRPIPCPTCRPHLAPHHCDRCGANRPTCQSLRILGGRDCCQRCTHRTGDA